MELTVLGSGTGVPRPDRASPGYWLQLESGENVLFDIGPGSLRQLAVAGGRPDDVDGLVYSHLHPDHTADLVHFLFIARFDRGGRRRPLWIAAPVGFRTFHRRLTEAWADFLDARTYELTIDEMSDGRRRFPAWSLTAAPTVHMEGSVCYRIDTDGGRSLVYSGDTEYAPRLVELARGTEVLLCECSFPDPRPKGAHCTPSVVGRMASEAAVGQVVLTHLYPEADRVDLLAQLRLAWPGPARVAADFLKIGMPEGAKEVTFEPVRGA